MQPASVKRLFCTTPQSVLVLKSRCRHFFEISVSDCRPSQKVQLWPPWGGGLYLGGENPRGWLSVCELCLGGENNGSGPFCVTGWPILCEFVWRVHFLNLYDDGGPFCVVRVFSKLGLAEFSQGRNQRHGVSGVKSRSWLQKGRSLRGRFSMSIFWDSLELAEFFWERTKGERALRFEWSRRFEVSTLRKNQTSTVDPSLIHDFWSFLWVFGREIARFLHYCEFLGVKLLDFFILWVSGREIARFLHSFSELFIQVRSSKTTKWNAFHFPSFIQVRPLKTAKWNAFHFQSFIQIRSSKATKWVEKFLFQVLTVIL